MSITEHSNLRLNVLTPELHARTCGYWYTITEGASPHTAFRDRAHVVRWLHERGLWVEGTDLDNIPEPAVSSAVSFEIRGKYRRASWLSYDKVLPLTHDWPPAEEGELRIETRVLSNGRYTLGVITRDPDGVRVVNFLNPNCKHRPEYDYTECREIYG